MDQQGDAGTGGFETRPYTLVFPGPRLLVSCPANSHGNLLVFFAVGCVALPRVVHAGRTGLKPAPTLSSFRGPGS